MTSLLVCSGVLAALHERRETGKGQRIDVSLLDAVVHAQCSGLGAYFLTGEVTPRTGNRSQYFAPSGIYACADGGRAAITCPSQKFFENLCGALGVDWDQDPRFASLESRLTNEDVLDALLAGRCAEIPRDELQARLAGADVLVAPINEIPDVASDPQIRHNDMIVTTQHASLGALQVTGVPIKLRGTPGSVRRSPPVHGQHTAEVLGELGIGADELSALERQGAVALAPEAGPSRA